MMSTRNLHSMTVISLRKLAKQQGVALGTLKKAGIVDALETHARVKKSTRRAKTDIPCTHPSTKAVAAHDIINQIGWLSGKLNETVNKLASLVATLCDSTISYARSSTRNTIVVGGGGSTFQPSSSSLSSALTSAQSLYNTAVNLHSTASNLYNNNKASIDAITGAVGGVANMLGVKTNSSATIGSALAAAGTHLENIGGAVNNLNQLNNNITNLSSFTRSAAPLITKVANSAQYLNNISAY